MRSKPFTEYKKPFPLITPKAKKIAVSSIRPSAENRPVSDDFIRELADSIGRIGLQHPISITPVPGRSPREYRVVDGNNRYRAFELLNLAKIPARILNAEAAEIQKFSANIHRRDASVLRRYEGIVGYYKIRQKVGCIRQNLSGGTQPHDKGISAMARALQCDRRMIVHALSSRKIGSRARKQLEKWGLDDNARLIGKVAEASDDDEQVKVIKQYRKARKKVRAGGPIRRSKIIKSNRESEDSVANKITVSSLQQSWKLSKFRELFESASPNVQGDFLKLTFEIDEWS